MIRAAQTNQKPPLSGGAVSSTTCHIHYSCPFRKSSFPQFSFCNHDIGSTGLAARHTRAAEFARKSLITLKVCLALLTPGNR